MEPVGEQLRQAREAQGLSLSDVARATKISAAALTALERGDVLRLPGGIFGRSFVRAYALQVGLDPDAIAAEFTIEIAEAERDSARKRVRASVTPDDREFAARQHRAIVILRRSLLVLAVVITVLVIWQVWAWRSRAAATTESPVPPPEPASQQTAATEPVATSVARELRVEVEATADCWMRVLANGLVIYERLLATGVRQPFIAQQQLMLDVGDAGAIRWTINGRAARAIGGSGVHRVITITRENVETFLE